MANNYGQFRSSQVKDYLLPISYSIINQTSKRDFAIVPEESFNGIDENGKINSYHIKCRIYKLSSAQTIKIYLKNTKKDYDNSKYYKTIKVPAGSITDYIVFEDVITPNDSFSYDWLYFELQRTGSSDKRLINIKNLQLDKIYNIITFLEKTVDKTLIIKAMKIQNSANLKMVINGEYIKIGKDGLYEINDEIKISSLGFIVNDNEIFILNYEY